MASGLPIVTTATCGMRDVIRDENNGLLIPIRSTEAIITKIERLMADAQLRERLGLAAQKDALQKYSWQQAAAHVFNAYQKLLEKGHGQRIRTKRCVQQRAR